MKVRGKAFFEAEQWFQEIENIEGTNPNRLCGCLIAGGEHYNKPHVHIGGYYVLVEEGDWIVTDSYGKKMVISSKKFDEMFEVVGSQEIKVFNKNTEETITRTFQEWMRRAVKLSETWNLDFNYLEVV